MSLRLLLLRSVWLRLGRIQPSWSLGLNLGPFGWLVFGPAVSRTPVQGGPVPPPPAPPPVTVEEKSSSKAGWMDGWMDTLELQ